MAKKLEDFPYVEITVRAYDTRPRDDGEGLLTFTTFPTEVHNGEKSKEMDENGHAINFLGDVSGGIGFVVISANSKNPDGDYYLMISHKDLWNAAAAAMRVR